MNIDQQHIYQFSRKSDISDWKVINDNVMGGFSISKLEINKKGYGVFTGQINTKNNGGFASINYSYNKEITLKKKKINIKLKADGKNYKIKFKNSVKDHVSYVKSFKTNGKWQTVSFLMSEMQPYTRGKKLNGENFNSEKIEKMSIVIANKVNEKFFITIDKIYLS